MLIFVDGFDAYNSVAELLRKWDATKGTSTLQTGYDGSGKALRVQANCRYWAWLNDHMTKIVGMNIMRADHGSQRYVMYFAGHCNTNNSQFDNQIHVLVQWNTDGTLQVTTPGSVVHSGTTVLSTSTWNHIELKVFVDPSAGSFELRVNGNAELSASGIDTQGSGGDAPMRLALGSNSSPTNGYINYDDLYVLDTDGSVNNDFLGPCRVDTLYPDADDTTGWDTSSGSSHFSLVNEATIDDDSSYVQSGVASALDLFHVNNLSVIPQLVHGVVLNSDMCNAGEGMLGFQLVVKSGGTSVESDATRIIASEYSRYTTILEAEPSTGLPWERASVEDAYYGFMLEAEE